MKFDPKSSLRQAKVQRLKKGFANLSTELSFSPKLLLGTRLFCIEIKRLWLCMAARQRERNSRPIKVRSSVLPHVMYINFFWPLRQCMSILCSRQHVVFLLITHHAREMSLLISSIQIHAFASRGCVHGSTPKSCCCNWIFPGSTEP